MDYGKAFSYVFEDKDWIKKVGIAAVVTLVPIVNFALWGYILEITRQVQQGTPVVLPEWDRFGEYFKNGFQAIVVYLVYLLPLLVIQICSGITQGIMPSIVANADSNTAGMLVTVVSGANLCFACLATILGIAGGLLVMPALGILADTRQIGPALRFADALALLRANLGGYIVSILIVAVAEFILAPIGVLVCVVGLFVVVAYLALVLGHLIGQNYRQAKGAAPMMQPA